MKTEMTVLYEPYSHSGYAELLVQNGVVESLPTRRYRAPGVRVRVLSDGTWGTHSEVPKSSTGWPADVEPLRSGDLDDPAWGRYPRPPGNVARSLALRSRADFCIPAFGPWPDNLYHWTLEILPRVFFALQAVPKGASVEIVIPLVATKDASFREMLDAVVDRPVNIRPTRRRVRFRSAVVADTVVSSEPVESPNGIRATRDTAIHPLAFLEFAIALREGLRRRVSQAPNLPNLPAQIKGMVFLDRGPAARRPYNRNEVLTLVAALGAEIVRPHELSRAELQGRLSQAQVVVAPHGAGITNVVLCENLSRLIVLTPETHVQQRALWTNIAGPQGATAVFVAGSSPDGYSDSDRRPHTFRMTDISAAFRHEIA